MRARIITLGAVTVSALSLLVVVWVITRPDFERPVGGSDPAPGWLGLIAPVAWTATGVTLLYLRPGNRVGALILLVAVCQALSQGAAAYGWYGAGIADPEWPGARWVAQLAAPLWIPGLLPMVTLLLAIYPDGRLPSPRWRLPAISTAFGIALLAFFMAGGYHDVAPGDPPLTIDPPTPVLVAYLVLMSAALIGGTLALWAMSIVRLLRARSPERQQLAWLICAVVASFALFFAPAWPGESATSAVIPVAIAVGVLRYHLLGIEIVLRRGLVYATLTAIVIGVYLLITTVAGSRLERGVPGVVAAALVAVGFTPVRERLQRGVDRLVYGDRRDPMRAVTRFGDSVAAAGEPEDLLPAVLMTVVNAVHASGAAVLSPEGRVVARRGSEGDGVTLPLRVSGRDVGTLRVAARRPGEPYTEGDLRLLSALVPQVAVVVRALELAEALEAERDRVVTATRTERDRLRRDLHDGLGPSLSGVGLGLQALESAIDAGDESVAAELLERVRLEAGTAVADVRRILDDLRPAALDEATLTSAMRRHADNNAAGIPIEIYAAPTLPVLPPEVESAAYRIAQEALTNVVRHASARTCRVRVVADDAAVTLEVVDDGRGLPGRAGSAGVGLASMRERAAEMGGECRVEPGADGGTRVLARVPRAGGA